jgi:transcriptional regulator with XRE-family HTH domain
LSVAAASLLGTYLRDRRTRLDPAALGFTGGRRRTPGLRREEVAQRANISPTWYTWLEQGRGGAPSADVLDRIAASLMLTEPEREHLFMIGLGHPPEVHFRPSEGVTPRLQRVLDAFEVSPAIVKNALWDVVAWNRAAAALLTDYGKLPLAERNILRLIFSNSRVRALQDDWQGIARFVVGAFRADAARAGAVAETQQFVEELSAQSPEFRQMWLANDVNAYGEGMKRLHHAELGLLELEFSAFAVDGRPDLGMVVYNPATSGDAERMRAYIQSRPLPV